MGSVAVDLDAVLGPVVGRERLLTGAELGDERLANLGIVQPQTTEQLSVVMRACYERRWPVAIFGQRTKLLWGSASLGKAAVAIGTANLNQVVDHWVEDFTVRVEAGATLAQLQSRLQPLGQFWPVDPIYGGRSSVGGTVATADSGSLRQRYGGVRDTVIGIQFVRYDGEVVKAGGRVVKNVAGYDLMKLMTGAYGSLGILSEVTLRLYPIAATSRSVMLSGSAESIAAAVPLVRGLTPTAMDLVAADGEVTLVGCFQGIEAAVVEQVERFEAIAAQAGLTAAPLAESWWEQRAQALSCNGALVKVGLLPTGQISLLQLAQQQLAPGWQGQFYSGSGLGLLRLAPNQPQLQRCLSTLRSHCEARQGYLTILEASDGEPVDDRWGYCGSALPLMRAIKEKFDPHSLLNPGRYVGGI